MKLSKKRREELADFFSFCVRRANELDDPSWSNQNDIARALLQIVGAARSGHWDVTGKFPGAPSKPRRMS